MNKLTLSEKDRKLIKEEKRIAYIFSALILLFGLLFNLFFVLIQKNTELLIYIDISIALICFLVISVMNRKYNLDLRDNEKIVKIEKVITKYEEASYEAGSGAMYIPFLGDLFPKLWGQKMKATQIYYLNINNYRNEIDKSLYESIQKGDFVEMYYTKHSNTLLEIKKIIILPS